MLRRSATMAGNSISGSFPPQLPPGTRGGGTGGWNFQDCLSPQNHMSGVGIYPTLLDTTITIAASSAWTRRTGGNWRLNA